MQQLVHYSVIWNTFELYLSSFNLHTSYIVNKKNVLVCVCLCSGNAAVVKPSEVCVHTAKVMEELLPAYLDKVGSLVLFHEIFCEVFHAILIRFHCSHQCIHWKGFTVTISNLYAILLEDRGCGPEQGHGNTD